MENKERALKITVSGKSQSGKTTLLNIIKRCLEHDYCFRTFFAEATVRLEEAIEDVPLRNDLNASETEK